METLQTRFPVGLEEGADGGFLAHALSLPGCVASGASAEEAVAALPDALAAWLSVLEQLGETVPPASAELELAVDEWVRSTAPVAQGESAALFEHDLEPLSRDEVALALRRLGDLRGRILRALRGVPLPRLDEPVRGVAPARVLDELARAQWWLLTRLGASPLAEIPDRVTGRLDTAMALVVQQLGELDDEARGARLEIDGESWTPRKVVRRLCWVEWTLGDAALRLLRDLPNPGLPVR